MRYIHLFLAKTNVLGPKAYCEEYEIQKSIRMANFGMSVFVLIQKKIIFNHSLITIQLFSFKFKLLIYLLKYLYV